MKKMFRAVLVLLILVLLQPVACYAAPDDTSTLTVTLHCDNSGVSLEDIAVSIVKVATWDEISGHFVLDSAFSDIPGAANGIFSAKDSPEIASALFSRLPSRVTPTTQKTDTAGSTAFSGLFPGAYLVYCANSSPVRFQPYLAYITADGGSVVSSPKTEQTPSRPTTSSPTVLPTDKEIPQMGNATFPIYVLLILGLMLLAFALGLLVGKHRKGSAILFAVLGAICLACTVFLFHLTTQADEAAGERAETLLTHTSTSYSQLLQEDMSEGNTVATLLAPQREMLGVISIPSVDLELPVQKEWGDEALEVSPCFYSATMDGEGLVIGAHNYKTHFGHLAECVIGDTVSIRYTNGTTVNYEINNIETLAKNELPRLLDTDSDLTLFTCTPGGHSRLVLRCSA